MKCEAVLIYLIKFFVYYSIYCIVNRKPKSKMAQTKQTPRNPHVSQPKTAVGSDVQPEGRTTPRSTSSKAPMKGGKQPQKHISQKLL